MDQPEESAPGQWRNGHLFIGADDAGGIGRVQPVRRAEIGILLKRKSAEVGRPGKDERVGLRSERQHHQRGGHSKSFSDFSWQFLRMAWQEM